MFRRVIVYGIRRRFPRKISIAIEDLEIGGRTNNASVSETEGEFNGETGVLRRTEALFEDHGQVLNQGIKPRRDCGIDDIISWWQ